jgi:hypothetical protein
VSSRLSAPNTWKSRAAINEGGEGKQFLQEYQELIFGYISPEVSVRINPDGVS